METWTPIKSEGDDRDYRVVRLENELMCLLVSDKETDKAGAAMNVSVGHFSDPEDLPGLAHFLEHMLFLGTKKYPDENSYTAFLSSHAGRSNAFTSTEDTNYYFDVAHDAFEEALDRFAQFFIGPLFTQDATNRELNAVHNENAKNLLNDMWRGFQFLKSTSNPDHAFSKFGTGNLETLKEAPSKKGVDTRDGLLKFHDTYYSSNVSNLVVLGRESLDELQAQVVAKFSGYANKNRKVPEFGPDALTGGLGKLYRVVPVKDLRSLSILWPLPSMREYYHSKPEHVLSHLLGHEGEGSVLQLLKTAGWANDLSAGLNQSCSSFSGFGVSLNLTEAGLDHIDEIVAIIFQYLLVLSKATDEQWRAIFKEVGDVSDMGFWFKGKETPFNYCSNLAGAMHKYPPEEILSGPWIFKKFELALIKDMLAKLQEPNVRIHIMSQSFKGKTTMKEQWYGTEYSQEPLSAFSAPLVAMMTNPTVNPELFLPAPNEFIATDFALTPQPTSQEKALYPVLLEGCEVKCWWKLDDTYFKPKANVVVRMNNPVAYSSPRNAVLTTLYTRLLEDSLVTFAYDADIAGLSYGFSLTATGLQLVFRGYNHKLPVLAARVLERMRELQVKEERFALIKEGMTRQFQNFVKEQPYQHAMYAQSHCTENLWHHREKLAVIEDLTTEDLKQHLALLLNEGFETEMLVHGNMNAAAAKEVAALISTGFKSLSASQVPSPRVVSIAPGQHCLLQARELNDADVNSSTLLSFQIGEDTLKSHARAKLLAHIMKEPCYNQLRTIEQLGYLVFSSMQRQRGVLSLQILLQSSDRPAHYLYQRAESFLDNTLRPLLEDIDDAQFEKEKLAVIAELEEKDKTLNQETNRHWGEILKRRYQFDYRAPMVAEVKSLTKESLLQFFVEFVACNGNRRVLNIQYFGAGHPLPTDAGFVAFPSEAEACLPVSAKEGSNDEVKEKKGNDSSKTPLPTPPIITANFTKIDDMDFHKFRNSMPMYPAFC